MISVGVIFQKIKNQLSENVIKLIKGLKHHYNNATKRCDNADKNKSLKQTLKQVKLFVNFAQTAPGTPHQN